MAATPPTSTAPYDLTGTISKFLDLHLMFPLLEFVDGNELLAYSKADIQRARLALVKPTNMVPARLLLNPPGAPKRKPPRTS